MVVKKIVVLAAVLAAAALAYGALSRDARRDIWEDVHHEF